MKTMSNKYEKIDPVFGPTLACPQCGSSIFVIYRGIMYDSEEEARAPPKEAAECFNCQTQTYVFALKTKYTDNDFAEINTIELFYKYECVICGEQYEDRVNTVEQVVYENTTFTSKIPDPKLKWQCPKHPEATIKTMLKPVGGCDDEDFPFG